MELDSLKDIADNSLRNVNFLDSKLGRMCVVFSTMISLNEDSYIYSFIDWKSVFSNVLSMKVTFKAIVYICN